MMKSKYKKDSLAYFKEATYRGIQEALSKVPEDKRERELGKILFSIGMTDEQFEELKAEVEKM